MLGLFCLRFSAFILVTPFRIGVAAKQADKQRQNCDGNHAALLSASGLLFDV